MASIEGHGDRRQRLYKQPLVRHARTVGNVRVSLLGGFAATVDDVPVVEAAWRLKKARELVKLLALAPGAPAAPRAGDGCACGANSSRPRPPTTSIRRSTSLGVRLTAARSRYARRCSSSRRTSTSTGSRPRPPKHVAPGHPRRIAQRSPNTAASCCPRTATTTGRRNGARSLPRSRRNSRWTVRDADRPPRLPADPSSFVGRSRELAELKSLLRDTRLLTLAGTGGVGKTRLALELARAVELSYSDGAALVELAAAHGRRTRPGRGRGRARRAGAVGQTLVDAVVEYLTPRSLLLVIDNCEHLLATTARLTDALLRSAPQLTILATSREPLRVPGEVVFRVPSLDIPDPAQTLEPSELLDYEAVRLFVERAGAAAPGFVLDERNAVDVARICFRLDGLPLALELAAGRLGALDPAAIAERLDDRFRVLRTLSHASPTRQQTLKAALQWSHDLLEPDERTLLRRLAAFLGGFELEAVENVCAGGELDESGIADVLARLVEKSLVVAGESSSRERRYRLLETVRAYARERLDEAGETSALAERHADWALALAERERGSPRLDRDAANLRVGLDTLLVRAPSDALRLCVALWQFWLRRIDLHEAQRRFDQVLAVAPERTALRAQALLGAAAIDFRSGALSRGFALAEESYAIASEIGDARAEWRALQFLGEFGLASDAADVAMPWLERALELARREGFAAAEAICVYSRRRCSLGPAGIWPAPRSSWPAASSCSARSPARRSGSSPRSTSRRSGRAHRAAGRGCAWCSRTRCSRSSRSPVTPRSATSWPTRRGSPAGVATAREPARCSTRAQARFEDAGDELGKAAVLVRRAYLELTEGALPAARQALEEALELRRAQATGAVSYSRSPGSDSSTRRPATTTAPSDASPRLATCFAVPAIDGGWRASSGGRPTLHSHAETSTTRRPRCWRHARCSARHSGSAGSQTRSLGSPRSHCCAATSNGHLALLADARDRYAARHDALGVADAEERLSDLAKGALSPRK